MGLSAPALADVATAFPATSSAKSRRAASAPGQGLDYPPKRK